MELKRFDGYWEAGLPYLDAVTLKPVPDGTVRLTALKTGDAGFIQLIPLESLAELQAAPPKDYVVRTVKGGGGFSAIILNSYQNPTADKLLESFEPHIIGLLAYPLRTSGSTGRAPQATVGTNPAGPCVDHSDRFPI